MTGRSLFCLLLCVLFVPCLGLPAQMTPASPAHAARASQQASQSPGRAATPAEKEAVKSYTLPPEKYREAVEYSRAQYRLYFIDFAYGVVILLLLLGWRLAPKYRDWAERVSLNRVVQAIVYTPPLLLTVAALGLPTDIYGHWLSRKYNQSVQGWGSWAWDWTKVQLLSFILGIFLVWILYAVIRRRARRWWFYFWLTSLPIVVFLQFISPVVIQPLFYKFTPLAPQHPGLVAEIEEVVQRAGMNIPPSRMYEMNASAKLKSLNAYVTGFGASKRVVVWDTTTQKMTVPETVFVFGHEMGHYVLHHIVKGMAFLAVLLFVFLYLGYRGLHWALRRWGARWGIRGVDDWASLPVLLLILSILTFLASPISNAYSRHLEHQADIYGLEVIHGIVPNSSQVAAQAFQVLGEVDLADPHPSPFIRVWLYTHPPIGDRVRFALSYDPWAKGESPKYVKGARRPRKDRRGG